jgi:hypothetical protein
MRTAVAFVGALTCACTPKPRGPTVLVHYVYPEQWTKTDKQYVEQASVSWKKLSLRWSFTEDANRSKNACPSDWPAKDLVNCVIDIGLYKKDGMFEKGTAGESNRDTNESWVDSRLSGLYLLHVVAHEIGHQVLNTWEHLTVKGIMTSGGDEIIASPADHALACKTIKRACK